MTVRFGVHIGPQNADIRKLRQLWKWLDRESVDWISVWDHLYEAPPAGGTQPHFEAVATLGAIAADTERARSAAWCSARSTGTSGCWRSRP
jgi:hypothetical protein